jgi:nucleoside-diphosphate-sugar epimerase
LTTNVSGTLNLLELCKDFRVKKFILASTSSLYAGCPMPFKETLPVNEPISPYAATKKGAEALCYTYHHLYGIDTTVFRYFTVYGPAGRPDMSYFKFMRLINRGKPIEIYGDGSQRRDFTYIDDIAEGTVAALYKKLGYIVINLGGNKAYSLLSLVRLLEKNLGKKAKIKHLPFSKADMKDTRSDIGRATSVLGWRPKVSLEEGIKKTVDWYLKNVNLVNKLHI